jgi:DNA invertase Pin-like site-specific DNA recombinase
MAEMKRKKKPGTVKRTKKPKIEETKNRTIGYIRVSTVKQDAKNQKLEILEYAQKNEITVDEFIEVTISSRQNTKARKIDQLLEKLSPHDTLIVSELSRLGRSVGQVMTMIDRLIEGKVRVIAIKEKMDIKANGQKDTQTTVMVSMFSTFAEIERQLISERTKAGLAARKAQGVILGRPKGSQSPSKLDEHIQTIKNRLSNGYAKSAIARELKVSRPTLIHYIKSRNIES